MVRKWDGIAVYNATRAREVSLQACMGVARLLDLGLAQKMLAEKPPAGVQRIAYALGTTKRSVQAIMLGKHWQQDPVKVRIWNEINLARVPEESGIPSADDLARFGFSDEEKRQKRAREKLDRQIRGRARDKRRREKTNELLKMAKADLGFGEAPSLKSKIVDDDSAVVEAVGRAAILRKEKAPIRLDTAYFQGAVDEALWRILRQLDDVKIGAMSGRELAAAAASLLEKRALLRGEPTQIVRNDNRATLEKVGELLVAEMVRRGRTIPGVGEMLDVTPKVAEGAPS